MVKAGLCEDDHITLTSPPQVQEVHGVPTPEGGVPTEYHTRLTKTSVNQTQIQVQCRQNTGLPPGFLELLC